MKHSRNVLEIYEKIDFAGDFTTQCEEKNLDPNSVEIIASYITAFLGSINVEQEDAIAIAKHHSEISKLDTEKKVEEYKQQNLNYKIPVGNSVCWIIRQ